MTWQGEQPLEVLLDGSHLKKMFLGASNYFQTKVAMIDNLNVFPVPDGDTGTNMNLTLAAAANAVQQKTPVGIGKVAEIAAVSALMHARGNSGVILSQLIRGLARGLAGKHIVTPREVSRAFQYGIVFAYKAVTQPVEGTMLTVAREIARGTRGAIGYTTDFGALLEQAIYCGKIALARTPELLPILKQAGVVDAGGMGLIVFLEGCLQGLKGEQPETKPAEIASLGRQTPQVTVTTPDLIFHYCTEIIVRGAKLQCNRLRKELEGLGDSLIMVETAGMVKIHVHTNHPGEVLEKCLKRGSIHDIKIDNMLDQHRQIFGEPETEEGGTAVPESETGVIAVSFGEGLSSLFQSLGIEVVSSEQGVNPGVRDFVAAINRVPARKLIILPNNGNIRLPAEQAKQLVQKEVQVIPTTSIQQGLAAAVAFRADLDLEANYTNMSGRVHEVKSGEITYAVRQLELNGIRVEKGAILGLLEGDIFTAGKNINEVINGLVLHMLKEGGELLTLYYGKEVKPEEAAALQEYLKGLYAKLEIQLYYGGQRYYYYFVALE
jgi:DAK2 domain fusion protein YloV